MQKSAELNAPFIPFKTGEPVTGEGFIPRPAEMQKLERLIFDVRQDVAIISPRRMGKSSLVLQLLKAAQKRSWFTAYVDVFRALDKLRLSKEIVNAVIKNSKSRQLFQKGQELLKNLIQSIRLKGSFDELSVDFGLADSDLDEHVLLEKSLEFPEKFASQSQKKLVMCFDEFAEIMRFNGYELLKLMRAVFQMHQNVAYIFIGSQTSMMNKIFLDPDQAFFQLADILTLRELDEELVRTYIIKSFQKLEIEVPEISLNLIIELIHCHPYYVQKICRGIFNICYQRKSKIELTDVHYVFEDIMISEEDFFLEIIANLKSKNQLYWIKKILDNTVTYQELPFDLMRSGLILHDKEKVWLQNPVFKQYVLKFLE